MIVRLSIVIFWHLICTWACARAEKVDEIIGNVIVDITSSLYVPCGVTAFLCTDAENLVQFSKQMSRNHVQHNIETSLLDYQFSAVDAKSAHLHFYILDLNCPGAVNLLLKADASQMFIAPTKWLILQDIKVSSTSIEDVQPINSESKIKTIFEDLHVLPDSEVIVAQRINKNFVKLLSIYRPSLSRSLIVEDRGTWSAVQGIQLYNYDMSSKRRLNLQQIPLTASIVITDPYTFNNRENLLKNLNFKRSDVVSKVSYLLIKLLGARMNANISFVFTTTWGYPDKNGTWNGLIGQLNSGEADIGATITFITAIRLDVVEYMQLHLPTTIRFIFRRPPLSHVANLFTLPFSSRVWIVSIVFCILGLALLYLTLKWEWKKVKNIPHEEKLAGELEVDPGVGDNFIILLGAVTQQGSYFELRTTTARIVFLMLLILCLSLYAAYAASIVALLQSTSGKIRSLENLAESPLKIGLMDVPYNHYYFKTFEDPVRKKFYEQRIKNQQNVWMSLEEGVEKLRTGLFAFHIDTTVAYHLIQDTYSEDEKCAFEEIDVFLTSYPLFPIRRQSPYKEILRAGALRLEETGLTLRHANLEYHKKPVCSGQTQFISVGTTECYAAYLTVGYGLMITVIIFICEMIWSKSFGIISADSTNTEIQETTFSASDNDSHSASEENTLDPVHSID